MARYMQVAKEANKIVRRLAEEMSPSQLIDLAYLINLVVRCSPRGVQHTVRRNIVEQTMQGTGVLVSMTEGYDHRTDKTFHKIVIANNSGCQIDNYDI